MELNLRTFLGHQNLLVSFRSVSLSAKNLAYKGREIPGTKPVSGAMSLAERWCLGIPVET
jgi:hypothetical protein